jgi:hypothetical protein
LPAWNLQYIMLHVRQLATNLSSFDEPVPNAMHVRMPPMCCLHASPIASWQLETPLHALEACSSMLLDSAFPSHKHTRTHTFLWATNLIPQDIDALLI